MIFKQYFLGCLAHASYLIGDEETRSAVIVDPQRDIDQYVHDAEDQKLNIRYVFLTHFHADFVAGHLELRNRVGAEICLGVKAQADFPFRAFRDGENLEFGKVRLQILETPGHTPEGISILVYDLEKSGSIPQSVLTGDTLFIGDVGRPDLMASVGVSADELGGMLYDSLQNKLLPLPDETLVYPAHGAGSMCGKNLSTDTFSTMQTQRRYNYALQPMKRNEFIRLVTANQPEAPQYFSYDAMLNRKERPTLDRVLEEELKPLSLEDVLKLRSTGAQLLDVRDPADFAGGHLTGSVNIGLGGKFATWAGTILSPKHCIVIIAEPVREAEAAMRLGRIGFDQVAGYLKGGMEALAHRADLVSRTARITAQTLADELHTAEPPLVLDVRKEQEWKDKHLAHSVNIPVSHLEERLDEVTRDRQIVVHCATGYRSSIAASLLEKHGFTNVMDLVGGIDAWEAAVEKPQASATGQTCSNH
ncbi:MAG: MBL fold metallo-hydrolase [Nitrospirales bacterium]|nr:MBL fold metallo-hydrolase [Nitrospira sp.]MDR4501634.1 MBL fold metallo-hydrolase [Nitrospirales bacterium]